MNGYDLSEDLLLIFAYQLRYGYPISTLMTA